MDAKIAQLVKNPVWGVGIDDDVIKFRQIGKFEQRASSELGVVEQQDPLLG